ncbi:MAG: Fe-S cluster assembly protein SufD, partial [Rhodanobacteraceae bacterium]
MTASVPFVQSMHDAALQSRLPGSGLAWLDAARADALQAFAARGLPDQRNELWKYSSLRALAQRAYAAGDAEASRRAVDAALLPAAALQGPRAVFVNGVFRADLSQLDALPEGVTVQSLASALREAPEPLRFLLDKRADDDDD